MTPVYINGSAAISPQRTWSVDALDTSVSYKGNKLNCIEPEYPEWIDIKQLRRMSRIMKMGIATALLSLKNANVKIPNAIITGTGFGCLDDTGNFLSRIIQNHEEALNPTPFIQSTHNTIGSHLALILQCQSYNQTYSHGAFSFESAILDGLLHLSEFSNQNILVGGIDEITETSHQIQSRFGIFKTNTDSLAIFRTKAKGTLHGEGSAWFVLSDKPGQEKIRIAGVKTFHRSKNPIQDCIGKFLSDHEMLFSDIDLVLAGKSGDMKLDSLMDQDLTRNFNKSSIGVYKHLYGEYPTSSSFALWLAHSILKTGIIPADILTENRNKNVNTILIYNQYFGEHQSLILLRKE